jgi:predicted RNA binding protein YcfA (HicA-like mRNA interferase family)
MSKVLNLPYTKIISALERDGWVVVRQRISNIRLQKESPEKTLKITDPAHLPVKRSTLAHILKQACMSVDRFIDLL